MSKPEASLNESSGAAASDWQHNIDNSSQPSSRWAVSPAGTGRSSRCGGSIGRCDCASLRGSYAGIGLITCTCRSLPVGFPFGGGYCRSHLRARGVPSEDALKRCACPDSAVPARSSDGMRQYRHCGLQCPDRCRACRRHQPDGLRPPRIADDGAGRVQRVRNRTRCRCRRSARAASHKAPCRRQGRRHCRSAKRCVPRRPRR